MRVIQNGVLLAQDFLDLTTVVLSGGEQGLLGLAFAPDYATSRRVFVNFTNSSGHTVIARFLRDAGDPLRADPATRFRSGLAGRSTRSSSSRSRTTTAATWRSVRTACCTSDSATAVRATIRSTTRRTRRRSSARCCGSTCRCSESDRAGDTTCRPTIRSSDVPGVLHGDLGVRPAQPVAVVSSTSGRAAPARWSLATSGRTRAKRLTTSRPRRAAGTTAGASARAHTTRDLSCRAFSHAADRSDPRVLAADRDSRSPADSSTAARALGPAPIPDAISSRTSAEPRVVDRPVDQWQR